MKSISITLFSLLAAVLAIAQEPVQLIEMNPGIANDTVAEDTSYFKLGDLDYNLLESVINNSAVNTQIMLQRGADPNTVSTVGNTPLMYAAEKGNLEIMKMLVESGAKVNVSGFKGETPLFLTIFHNDFQAAKYLLEQGADPNVKDDFGVTPLIYAAATNQYQSADLLMFYEADPEVSDEEGNDPLLAAVTFENIETSDVLLQNGLDPNTRDARGNTPMIVTVQRGNYDILDLLLEYDADVNIANNKNYTPLAYALTYNDVKASTLLVSKGANVNHLIERGLNMAEIARITRNDSLVDLIDEAGGELPPGLDFSEFQLTYSNAFNSTDYFIGFRGGMVDSRRGFFWETGIDYRPFLLRIQTMQSDTLFQYRERRIGWSHSIGKYFTLYQKQHLKFSAYASATGLLSFPRYSGTSLDPGTEYKVIPSAGLALSGRYVGVKAGADWYDFSNTLDKGLKVNVSFFFRISYPQLQYDRKEISWE